MRAALVVISAMLACGCASEKGPEPAAVTETDASVDVEVDAPAEPSEVHDFPPFEIPPGDESDEWCQQWTPGHDETWFVNWVRMKSEGGFHHMNFFFVPETHLEGPDGTFRCSDRGYVLQLAALAGGVFYAQSTQAREETQSFVPGAAIAIPPGHKILGSLHLLNTGGKTLTTRLRFEIGTIPENEVSSRLTGFTLSYGALDIPAHAHSTFGIDCDFDGLHQQLLKRPIDFSIHRMLPHYHALGEKMRIELVGGARDGELLLDSETSIGEPAGVTPSPPISMLGAESIRLSCGYHNPGDEAVGWGIGKNEMCVLFGFSDSELLWAADTVAGTGKVVGSSGGVIAAEAQCTVLAVPSKAH